MQTQSFFHYLEFEKRYSEHTLTAYENDLNQFADFLAITYQISEINEIQPVHIRSWMVDLINRKITTRSVNRKLSALKTFFKFNLKRGDLSKNPMAKIQNPKSGKKLPVFVSKEHLEELFTKITFPNNFEGIRDKIILRIFYETGIRVSELINLKKADFDFEQQQLKILGKGRKERLIPFTYNFEKEIINYFNYLETTFPERGFAEVIVNNKGKHVNHGFVSRIVKKYLSLVTTVEKKSPHVLRHSFATHLSDAGADLNAIKDLLGHSSLAATQVYTHNSIEKLRKVYELAHPKAKT